MRNTRFLPVLLAMVLAAGAVMDGCTSAKRQASDNLRDAVNKAQRQSLRALVLMANPYYVDKTNSQVSPLGTTLPGAEKADEATKTRKGLEEQASRVELPDVADVNPQVIKDLEEAQKVLEGAIIANAAAGDPEKALAKSWLSNVVKLKGQYYWNKAFAECRQIAPLLEQVDHQVTIARSQAGGMKVFDSMMTMGTKKVEELLTSSKQAQDTLTGQIAKLQGEIAELKPQIEKTGAEVEATRNESATIVAKCRETADNRAVEMFDQAMAKNDEADKTYSKLQDMEFQMQGKQDNLKDLQMQLALVQAEVQAAQESLKNQQGVMGSTSVARTAAQDTLKKARGAIVEAMEQALKYFAAGQEDAAKAMSLTTDGTKQISQAANLEPTGQVLAEQAGLNMDLGNLNNEIRTGEQKLTIRLQQLDQTWKDLGGDKELPAPPKANPEDYRIAAVAAFKEAVSTYEKAIQALGRNNANAPNIRWVYQGSQAAAYMALAAVSPEDRSEATAKAAALRDSARSQREESPYLNNVNKLDESK